MEDWVGVDFDGTLATYKAGDYHKHGPLHLGEPIPAMVERVKAWLAAGRKVKIMTARVIPHITTGNDREYEAVLLSMEITKKIEDWTEKHLGQVLEVTCIKNYGMLELWDDRAVAVETNTGKHLGGGRL